MRIDHITLVGYRRFGLNNISVISLTFKEILQLILGTNGSGKSSLIEQLTPLPADPKDFTKEGSKTIRITHRGNTYVLTSKFINGNKHSFIKDTEEMNPGGTGTAQKELVRQEFGLTPDIHELLTNQETFTSMSPSRRREWFMQLSDTDYDYAFRVYNKLKERSRDISGALKLAKKRLVTEIAKVISADDEKRLTDEVNETLTELELLQSVRAPVDKPVAEYQSILQRHMDELTRLSTRLLRIRLIAPYGTNPEIMPQRNEWGELKLSGFTSLEEIDTVINHYKSQESVKQILINGAVTEHGKLSETMDVLIKTGAEGTKALVEKRQRLHNARLEILGKRKLDFATSDPQSATNALEAVSEQLQAIFSAIPSNEDKRYTQARLGEVQQLMFDTQTKRGNHAMMLQGYQRDARHMENHKTMATISCPACSHTWVNGYSEESYQHVLKLATLTEEEIETLDKQLKALQEEKASIEEYGTFYRDYVRTVRSWPVLNSFWQYLDDTGFVVRSPRMVISALETYRMDLGFEIDALKIDREIDELQQLIRSSEQVGDANLADIREKRNTIGEQISTWTEELSDLRTRVQAYQTYRRQLDEAIELGHKIRDLQENAVLVNESMVEMLRRETINHCIRQLQSTLARKEETLGAVALQKGIIVDLEKQIENLTIQDEAAKLLVKHLSPTDGLIAEGLLGFIRVFTTQMNAIIRKVWSYPLVVQDCGISGEAGAELDYKFPMMVQTKDNLVPDVSRGSTGMKEIVNLAFKVVAMRWLNITEGPLYLDEFAASFDEAHKSAASTAIKALMDQQPFTQLFIISHNYSQYGQFARSEVCVLDERNITVPATYNQHVVINKPVKEMQ
jgi:DNA repair exonuclease SbcCD ATPase subunit